MDDRHDQRGEENVKERKVIVQRQLSLFKRHTYCSLFRELQALAAFTEQWEDA